MSEHRTAQERRELQALRRFASKQDLLDVLAELAAQFDKFPLSASDAMRVTHHALRARFVADVAQGSIEREEIVTHDIRHNGMRTPPKDDPYGW